LSLKNLPIYTTKRIVIECNTSGEHIVTGSEKTDSPLQEFVNFFQTSDVLQISDVFL